MEWIMVKASDSEMEGIDDTGWKGHLKQA